jgi:radical SAM-linked protein
MKKQRCRIHFSKTEQMRFTGHLDLILTWERSFRRAGLPLAYSEGFSPRPVLNMASPLPLGFTSTGEIGDFWLSEVISLSKFYPVLEKSLPPGLRIQETNIIEDLFGPKLPALVTAASYSITLSTQYPDLLEKIEGLLNTPVIIRNRKGKTYDLRPLIQNLELVSNDNSNPNILQMTLKALPGKTGRPDEILAALELSMTGTRICRTEIILGAGKE